MYNKKILTEKISDDKLDAVFYYGDEILEIAFLNGKKLIFESRGELELIDENSNKHKGINALEYLIENNFNDDKLGKISVENDMLLANNWFEAILLDINGENLGDCGIFGSYDEVLENADNIAEELVKEFYR